MTVASDVIDRLIALMEGTASPAPSRAITQGRFVHTELDQDMTLAAGVNRPYPFGLLDPRKYQPLGTPSTVAASHVWRGQDLLLWVAYSYDEHDRTARYQEVLDDEVTIHRCLSDPMSWLAVTGAGIVEADEGDVQDDSDNRLFILAINVRFTLRESYA